MENYNDQLSRLNLMADDDGTTWDLSENDQAAISAVLDKLSSVEAERDNAVRYTELLIQERAGEARAVEALKRGRALAQKVVGETWDLAGSFTDDEQALFDWVEDLDWLRYPTTALDWLAQVKREAAVRELEQLMKNEWIESFELKASIYARIAALANQQPTACPRSEVRGEGES
jgi:hypothetical protein